jgi:hypothetical protein
MVHKRGEQHNQQYFFLEISSMFFPHATKFPAPLSLVHRRPTIQQSGAFFAEQLNINKSIIIITISIIAIFSWQTFFMHFPT